MNGFKKLVVAAMAAAAFGLATVPSIQASDAPWKHANHVKQYGDYGMRWSGPSATRGRAAGAPVTRGRGVTPRAAIVRPTVPLLRR